MEVEVIMTSMEEEVRYFHGTSIQCQHWSGVDRTGPSRMSHMNSIVYDETWASNTILNFSEALR
jgi:hypothetical protein